MSDTISVHGIRGFGHHGVLESERITGQEFFVDVVLRVNTAESAKFDDLTLTVDYADVAKRVHGLIVGEPFQLIETLADRIASDLLAIARVTGVTVTVHKPHAPIPVEFADVTVTVNRGQ